MVTCSVGLCMIWCQNCGFKATLDVLKPPGLFHFIDTNLDDAGRCWERQFRTYFAACELSKKEKKVQVASHIAACGWPRGSGDT